MDRRIQAKHTLHGVSTEKGSEPEHWSVYYKENKK